MIEERIQKELDRRLEKGKRDHEQAQALLRRWAKEEGREYKPQPIGISNIVRFQPPKKATL